MKVAVVQHEPSEPAGAFDDLLGTRGIPARTARLDETNELPTWTADAALVLMGGSMSANDEEVFPWLVQEKALVRDALQKGRPVLGICLGAQVIASALGVRVYESVPETGWTALAGTTGNPLFPAEFMAFELHGETFDLPPGARLLATGTSVPNQAFSVGSALGLQFHLEATAPMIEKWSAHLPPEMRRRCLEETGVYGDGSRRLCGTVLDYVLRL